jgi:ATP-dependent DNA helicase MPH1
VSYLVLVLIMSKVVERFKKGEWNVMVCTSIGEEGLDIGEIDVIVCYDAQKTPIRMVIILDLSF